MTQSEKEHLSAVAALGCAICRRLGFIGTAAEIHHLRAGQGWGRSSHYCAIPACPEHHRGKTGIHGLGTKGFVRHYGFTEQDLLDETLKLLEETRKRESIFPR
jgi:hypothetical protein